MPKNTESGSSDYAIRHAEKARGWRTPKTGGYSAVVPPKFVKASPPKGRGAATPAARAAS